MALPIGALPEQPPLDPEDVELPVDVEVEDEPPKGPGEVLEHEDGSADIVLDEEEHEDYDTEFDENLAEVFPETWLRALGTEYKDLVDQDIEARSDRDKKYAEGIKRTGLGDDAPGGAAFDGATKVVHPLLAKGCVDFASRAVKELFPANGPCKTQIVGEQTEAKLDKADRKKKYMNWQATTQVEENRAELERLLSQVPLGGAQYKRWWWDPELRRPRTEAIFIDDVFTPYGHSDFYTSPRVAYRQRIMQGEFDRRVRTGLYRELNLGDPTISMSDSSASRAATDKVEGVTPDSMVYDQEGLRTVWQIEVQMECEHDTEVDTECTAPYIIHIDDSTGDVLGLFRNWKPDDERRRKKHWTSEWPFIPWRGGPAIGLAHLIGSMAGAATGALRSILDAAHIQNFPGGLKLKGGRTAGQSKQVDATTLMELDAPPDVDDIRKLVMPFPFNGPSSVLFQLLEWITGYAENVVSSASEKIAEAGGDMPVGTAMALIEHNGANFSAIHARLHQSMKRDLEILHRLDAEHIEDDETVEELGELIVNREDFQGPMDIIPVSDPNIFSETQRYAQLQAVMQLMSMPQFAGFFKPDQLLARFLKLLQVPDVDGITSLPKETKKLSPSEENYAVALSERPLKVYEEQDDLNHLKSHVQFATSPMFGGNPLIAPVALPGLLQHCKEHIMALYKKHVRIAKQTVLDIARKENLPMTESGAEVQAGAFMDQVMSRLLGPMVMPGLQAMQEMMGKIAEGSAPKPDPNIMAQEKTKLQLGMAKIEAEKGKWAKEAEVRQGELDIESKMDAMGAASTERLAALASSVELIRDQQNNASKQLMLEFQAMQERNMLFLSTVLKNAGGTPASTGPDGEVIEGTPAMPGFTPDVLAGPIMQTLMEFVQEQMSGAFDQQGQNLQEILAKERLNNEGALSRLGESLAALQNQATAERQVELYTGPDGVKRARSFVPGAAPQQPQLPPPEGPPQ